MLDWHCYACCQEFKISDRQETAKKIGIAFFYQNAVPIFGFKFKLKSVMRNYCRRRSLFRPGRPLPENPKKSTLYPPRGR
jgi:hypothetical protein